MHRTVFFAVILLVISGCKSIAVPDLEATVGPRPVAESTLIQGHKLETAHNGSTYEGVIHIGAGTPIPDEIMQEFLTILDGPGIFDGSESRQYRVRILSLESQEDLSVMGVLIGNGAATANGQYNLEDGAGRVLRTDKIETSATATFDDAVSKPGRQSAALKMAIIANIHAYRQVLIDNAATINDSY